MTAQRRRPTLTIVVPYRVNLDRLIGRLVDGGHTFTVEASTTQQEVWHVGILDEAVSLVQEAFGDRLHDAGTLGDHLKGGG